MNERVFILQTCFLTNWIVMNGAQHFNWVAFDKKIIINHQVLTICNWAWIPPGSRWAGEYSSIVIHYLQVNEKRSLILKTNVMLESWYDENWEKSHLKYIMESLFYLWIQNLICTALEVSKYKFEKSMNEWELQFIVQTCLSTN